MNLYFLPTFWNYIWLCLFCLFSSFLFRIMCSHMFFLDFFFLKKGVTFINVQKKNRKKGKKKMNSDEVSFDSETSILSTISKFRNFTFDVDEVNKNTNNLENQLQSVVTQIKAEYEYIDFIKQRNQEKKKQIDEKSNSLKMRKEEIEDTLKFIDVTNKGESNENDYKRLKEETEAMKQELGFILNEITKYNAISRDLDEIDADGRILESKIEQIENQKSEFAIRRAQAEKILRKPEPIILDYHNIENSLYIQSLQIDDIDAQKRDVKLQLNKLEELIYKNEQKKKALVYRKRFIQKLTQEYVEEKASKSLLLQKHMQEEEEDNYESLYSQLDNLGNNRNKINMMKRSLRQLEQQIQEEKIVIQQSFKKKQKKIQKLQQKYFDLSKLVHEVDDMCINNKILKDKYQNLYIKKRRIERQNELYETKKVQIQEMKQQNHELSNNIREIKAKVELKNNEITQKRDAIIQMNAQIMQLESELSVKEFDIQDLEGQLNQLEDKQETRKTRSIII